MARPLVPSVLLVTRQITMKLPPLQAFNPLVLLLFGSKNEKQRKEDVSNRIQQTQTKKRMDFLKENFLYVVAAVVVIIVVLFILFIFFQSFCFCFFEFCTFFSFCSSDSSIRICARRRSTSSHARIEQRRNQTTSIRGK